MSVDRQAVGSGCVAGRWQVEHSVEIAWANLFSEMWLRSLSNAWGVGLEMILESCPGRTQAEGIQSGGG